MPDVTIANTTAGVQNKTLMTLDASETVTGLKAFSRGANPPFSVNAGATLVANLDADKLDGLEAAVFARWDGTGPGLGQIAFPATQNPSTDANVLDDYEEGSWPSAPVIGGSGGESSQSYTTQIGRYVKIGKIVIAQFTIVLSVKGTITTSVQIKNFPFTSENISGLSSVCVLQFTNLATTWVNVIAVLANNSTAAFVRGTQVAAILNATDLTTADIANATGLVGTMMYRASA